MKDDISIFATELMSMGDLGKLLDFSSDTLRDKIVTLTTMDPPLIHARLFRTQHEDILFRIPVTSKKVLTYLQDEKIAPTHHPILKLVEKIEKKDPDPKPPSKKRRIRKDSC